MIPRVGDAGLIGSSILFPGGTLGSGLPRIATSGGTTKIRFPAPGEVSPQPTRRARSPEVAHTQTFGFAYANELARGAIFSKEYAKFPIGSILVREKLLAVKSSKPEVLVVMIKRDRGFNRKANDWEFLTVSGDLKRIEKREKEGKCQQCHKSQAGNDFAFRYPVTGMP